MQAANPASSTSVDSTSFVIRPGQAWRSEKIAIRFSGRGNPPHSLKQWLILEESAVRDRYEQFTKVTHDWKDGARHPELSDYCSRLLSFDDWPKLCPARPTDLAAAGLYYAGFAEGILDATRCWYCDHGFCFWEKNDDPKKEHEKSCPDCPFLRSIN